MDDIVIIVPVVVAGMLLICTAAMLLWCCVRRGLCVVQKHMRGAKDAREELARAALKSDGAGLISVAQEQEDEEWAAATRKHTVAAGGRDKEPEENMPRDSVKSVTAVEFERLSDNVVAPPAQPTPTGPPPGSAAYVARVAQPLARAGPVRVDQVELVQHSAEHLRAPEVTVNRLLDGSQEELDSPDDSEGQEESDRIEIPPTSVRLSTAMSLGDLPSFQAANSIPGPGRASSVLSASNSPRFAAAIMLPASDESSEQVQTRHVTEVPHRIAYPADTMTAKFVPSLDVIVNNPSSMTNAKGVAPPRFVPSMPQRRPSLDALLDK